MAVFNGTAPVMSPQKYFALHVTLLMQIPMRASTPQLRSQGTWWTPVILLHTQTFLLLQKQEFRVKKQGISLFSYSHSSAWIRTVHLWVALCQNVWLLILLSESTGMYCGKAFVMETRRSELSSLNPGKEPGVATHIPPELGTWGWKISGTHWPARPPNPLAQVQWARNWDTERLGKTPDINLCIHIHIIHAWACVHTQIITWIDLLSFI